MSLEQQSPPSCGVNQMGEGKAKREGKGVLKHGVCNERFSCMSLNK